MSGGSFDYDCFKISQFADNLKARLASNKDKDNEFGWCPDFNEETIDLLKQSHKIIDMAGRIAHHIEWLYSGDHGEDTFKELMDEEILKETTKERKFLVEEEIKWKEYVNLRLTELNEDVQKLNKRKKS
jgi:hypothetical protein